MFFIHDLLIMLRPRRLFTHGQNTLRFGVGNGNVLAGMAFLLARIVPSLPQQGAALYVELRRDGRPVDPQPWLAPSEEGRDDQNGDQRVRE